MLAQTSRSDIDDSRRVTNRLKACLAPRLGLARIHRGNGMGQPTLMNHVIAGATQRTFVSGVDDVERERRLHADRWVQPRWGRPSLEPNPGNGQPGNVGRRQRHLDTVAGHHCRPVDDALDPHLEPLDRRVDVASRAVPVDSSPSTCHGSMAPRSSSVMSSTVDARRAGESELDERIEPGGIEFDARGGQIVDHLEQIALDEPGQQVPVVQRGAPPDRIVPYGGLPAAATMPRTSSACTRAICGWGGISNARSSSSPSRPLGVGAEELVDAELGSMGVAGQVDQQVAQQPVDHPRGDVVVPSRSSSANAVSSSYSDVVSGLVDPRSLARRADESTGEEVRERRVVLPVGDQRRSRSGRRSRGCRRAWPAEGHVIAAAGAGVGAVDVEAFSVPSRLARASASTPSTIATSSCQSAGRRNVDLDHAGVGRDHDRAEPRIAGKSDSPR